MSKKLVWKSLNISSSHSIIYNVLLCICCLMVSNVSADILSDNYGGDRARGPHPLMQMGPVHFQTPPCLGPPGSIHMGRLSTTWDHPTSPFHHSPSSTNALGPQLALVMYFLPAYNILQVSTAKGHLSLKNRSIAVQKYGNAQRGYP